jgi:hypothetical protein
MPKREKHNERHNGGGLSISSHVKSAIAQFGIIQHGPKIAQFHVGRCIPKSDRSGATKMPTLDIIGRTAKSLWFLRETVFTDANKGVRQQTNGGFLGTPRWTKSHRFLLRDDRSVRKP